MLLWWERSSPSVFLRVKVSSPVATAPGIRREARIVAAQFFVDFARQRDFLLGGKGGYGLRVIADRGIAVIWRQDIVLLIGLNQRGAFQHALNQQGNALFGERLRAGCARFGR